MAKKTKAAEDAATEVEGVTVDELAGALRRATWHDDSDKSKMAGAILSSYILVPRAVEETAEEPAAE